MIISSNFQYTRFLVCFDCGDVKYVSVGSVFHLMSSRGVNEQHQVKMEEVWKECRTSEGRELLRLYFFMWPRIIKSGREVGEMVHIIREGITLAPLLISHFYEKQKKNVIVPTF